MVFPDSNKKKSIALVHPRLGRGGSETRVMWAIEALRNDYAISLLTSGPVDWPFLNSCYGTAIPEDTIRFLYPYWAHTPLGRYPHAAAFRGAFFQRFCQSQVNNFDLMISCYNVCDFGVPAIHFVADFSWDETLRIQNDPMPFGKQGIVHRVQLVRKPYLKLTKWLSRPSGRDLCNGKDVIVANSRWTSSLLLERYGCSASVIYPPVIGNFPETPTEKREFGAVCIGRLSHEKRIERIISILASVRKQGHNLHLHVIGDAGDPEYGKNIATLAKLQGLWVHLEGHCIGEQKARLLSSHIIGLHGREGEAFGISVAEMVKAGCIVFAPAAGGQAEILNHPDLLYADETEAVKKICTMLDDPSHQTMLRDHLTRQAELFSTQVFCTQLRELVEHRFAEKEYALGS